MEHLEEELQIKNQELELISEDRKHIKKENAELESKCLYL